MKRSLVRKSTVKIYKAKDPNVFLEFDKQIVLGRNMFGLDDRRCSRSQVELSYNSRTGIVQATKLGANESFYKNKFDK